MKNETAPQLKERFKDVVDSLSRVLHELEATPGLAEAQRLGARVVSELLTEVLRDLAKVSELTELQTANFRRAGEDLLSASQALAMKPTPAQIGSWLEGLDPVVRRFGHTLKSLRK